VNNCGLSPINSVASATIGGQVRNYQYDANGNLTSDGIRTLTYNPHNLPISITGSNPSINALGGNTGTPNSLTFSYDGDHARIKETATNHASGTAATTTTLYIGNSFFERIQNPDGSIDFKHYLNGPEGTLGVFTRRLTATPGSNATALKYWHRDHLGSPMAEYDATSFTNLSFDSWGLRRDPANINSANISLSLLASYQTSRGYTGHTHLDEVGYIHMNGRIYDPLIGRFLQPDPIIQEPYNSQNFNRYTYVLNSPLSYTDPSGYSFWTEVRRPVAAIAVTWLLGPGAYSFSGIFGAGTGLGIAGSFGMTGVAAGYASAAAAGFAAGGISGGNIQSAIAGAFSGMMMQGIGGALGHAGEAFLSGTHLTRIAAHAAVGCAMAGVQGGSCGAGAASAGFAAFAGPLVHEYGFSAGLVTSIVSGGIGAQVAGGSFGNGAFTGAFGYLLNSAGDIRKEFSYGTGGHHTVPAESLDILAKSGVKVSSEMGKEFGQIKIRGVADHKYDSAHRAYNVAVADELKSWAKASNIDLAKATSAHARTFAAHVVNNSNPAISGYLTRIIQAGIKSGSAPYSRLRGAAPRTAPSMTNGSAAVIGALIGAQVTEALVQKQIRACLSGAANNGGC
jgi:RHS repeat-associated protein